MKMEQKETEMGQMIPQMTLKWGQLGEFAMKNRPKGYKNGANAP